MRLKNASKHPAFHSYRNVISLGGQVLSFVSLLMLCFFFVCILMLSENEAFERTNFLLILVMYTPLQSFLQLIASPEMRRHTRLESKLKQARSILFYVINEVFRYIYLYFSKKG